MRTIAGLVVLSVTACSFALSGPHEPAVPHEHCDTESDAPTRDVAGAVVFLGIAGGAFVTDATAPRGAEGRGYPSLFIGGPSMLVGLVYAVAAADGFDKLSRCRAARQQLEEARSAREDAPVDGSAAHRSWQSSHE